MRSLLIVAVLALVALQVAGGAAQLKRSNGLRGDLDDWDDVQGMDFDDWDDGMDFDDWDDVMVDFDDWDDMDEMKDFDDWDDMDEMKDFDDWDEVTDFDDFDDVKDFDDVDDWSDFDDFDDADEQTRDSDEVRSATVQTEELVLYHTEQPAQRTWWQWVTSF